MDVMNTLARWNELKFKPLALFTDEDVEAFMTLQDFYEKNPHLRIDRTVISKMRNR